MGKLCIACLLTAPALLAGAAGERGPKEVEPSGLLAGVARADISPPSGIAHLNWGAQCHVDAIGVDPAGMKATALVLSDGKQRFAMVDIDTVAIREMDGIPRRASELTGIPELHIRLGASHTHSGPNLSLVRGPVGKDLSAYRKSYETYRAAMADKIVGAIVEANSRLEPVHVGAAKGAGTINVNRRVRARDGAPASVGRNPDGFVDRDLLVVRFDRADGAPLAVLINYQCHGTVLAWDNQLVSPDWIGSARIRVEQALPGATAILFQGAAGDQGPVEGFTGDLSVAHRLGSILGLQAAALALQVSTVRREPVFEGFVESTALIARQPWRVSGPNDAVLRFAHRDVDLERRRFSAEDVAEMETMANEARKRAEQIRGQGDPAKLHMAEARWRRYRDLAAQRREPADTAPLRVRIQALRIGEIAIVAMPGEPFSEIGAAVKKASPFAYTMFCGYSNGPGGDYVPTEAEYSAGGYEVERTPYAPSAAGAIVRAANALLEELR